MFIQELKKFSKENWWVYILFIVALGIVAYTGKGNIIEIILLFFANFLGNLCIMSMQSNYTAKNNKMGAIFQVCGTAIFFALGIYGLMFLGQKQYIIWQIAYTLSAIKAFTFYNFKKDLKFINGLVLSITNVVFLGVFYRYFYSGDISFLIQAIGFSLSSTGFVLLDDTKRFYTILFGTWFIAIGSLLITYNSFIKGSMDGIALGYFILTSTVGIYYLKLLKKYI